MKKTRLSDAVIALGLSLIFLLSLSRTLAFTLDTGYLVLITSALVLTFALMSRFKWLGIVLAAAALLFLLFAWRSSLAASFVDFLGSFYQWIWGVAEAGYSDPRSAYMLFTLALICFAVTLPVFLLIRFNAHVLLPLIIGCAIFFSQQLLGFSPSPIYFFSFLAFVAVYAARQAMPATGLKGDLLLLLASPLCVLVVAAAAAMPVSEQPAGVPVVAAAQRLAAKLPDWVNFSWMKGPFSPPQGTYVDFGDVAGDLGGEVRLSDATVLFVKGDRPVYLKSRSYTTFTGRRWNADDPEFLWQNHVGDGAPIEIWELPALLEISEGNDPENYELAEMSVHYWDIATDKIYSPHLALDYTVADEFVGKIPLYRQANGDVMAKQTLKKDFSYAVTVMRPKIQRDRMLELYRLCYQGLWQDVSDNENRADFKSFFSELSYHSRLVGLAYGQLPESITDRTRTLAETITAGADNPYDKALAVERYLRGNYTYNTAPPELPEDADFVDHFLFEGKEGYCTYFATAMTVLCRCVGIPARYVEGYAPADTKREGYYVVTGQQAHAWTEVYLEGAGWVPFEPTSAYSSDAMRAQQAAAPSVAPPSAPVPSMPGPSMDEGVVPTPDTMPGNETPGRLNPVYPIAVAAALLLLLIAVQAVRRRSFKRRVREGHFSSETVQRLHRRIERNLTLSRTRRSPWETQVEFAEKADTKYATGGVLAASSNVFYKVRFGDKQPAQADREAMLRALDEAEKISKLELGWRLLYLRYLLGFI